MHLIFVCIVVGYVNYLWQFTGLIAVLRSVCGVFTEILNFIWWQGNYWSTNVLTIKYIHLLGPISLRIFRCFIIIFFIVLNFFNNLLKLLHIFVHYVNLDFVKVEVFFGHNVHLVLKISYHLDNFLLLNTCCGR